MWCSWRGSGRGLPQPEAVVFADAAQRMLVGRVRQGRRDGARAADVVDSEQHSVLVLPLQRIVRIHLDGKDVVDAAEADDPIYLDRGLPTGEVIEGVAGDVNCRGAGERVG